MSIPYKFTVDVTLCVKHQRAFLEKPANFGANEQPGINSEICHTSGSSKT